MHAGADEGGGEGAPAEGVPADDAHAEGAPHLEAPMETDGVEKKEETKGAAVLAKEAVLPADDSELEPISPSELDASEPEPLQAQPPSASQAQPPTSDVAAPAGGEPPPAHAPVIVEAPTVEPTHAEMPPGVATDAAIPAISPPSSASDSPPLRGHPPPPSPPPTRPPPPPPPPPLRTDPRAQTEQPNSAEGRAPPAAPAVDSAVASPSSDSAQEGTATVPASSAEAVAAAAIDPPTLVALELALISAGTSRVFAPAVGGAAAAVDAAASTEAGEGGGLSGKGEQLERGGGSVSDSAPAAALGAGVSSSAELSGGNQPGESVVNGTVKMIDHEASRENASGSPPLADQAALLAPKQGASAAPREPTFGAEPLLSDATPKTDASASADPDTGVPSERLVTVDAASRLVESAGAAAAASAVGGASSEASSDADGTSSASNATDASGKQPSIVGTIIERLPGTPPAPSPSARPSPPSLPPPAPPPAAPLSLGSLPPASIGAPEAGPLQPLPLAPLPSPPALPYAPTDAFRALAPPSPPSQLRPARGDTPLAAPAASSSVAAAASNASKAVASKAAGGAAGNGTATPSAALAVAPMQPMVQMAQSMGPPTPGGLPVPTDQNDPSNIFAVLTKRMAALELNQSLINNWLTLWQNQITTKIKLLNATQEEGGLRLKELQANMTSLTTGLQDLTSSQSSISELCVQERDNGTSSEDTSVSTLDRRVRELLLESEARETQLQIQLQSLQRNQRIELLCSMVLSFGLSALGAACLVLCSRERHRHHAQNRRLSRDSGDEDFRLPSTSSDSSDEGLGSFELWRDATSHSPTAAAERALVPRTKSLPGRLDEGDGDSPPAAGNSR